MNILINWIEYALKTELFILTLSVSHIICLIFLLIMVLFYFGFLVLLSDSFFMLYFSFEHFLKCIVK